MLLYPKRIQLSVSKRHYVKYWYELFTRSMNFRVWSERPGWIENENFWIYDDVADNKLFIEKCITFRFLCEFFIMFGKVKCVVKQKKSLYLFLSILHPSILSNKFGPKRIDLCTSKVVMKGRKRSDDNLDNKHFL